MLLVLTSPAAPSVRKSSWSSLVQDPIDVEVTCLAFEVVKGVAEVSLSEDILEDATPLWSAFVVGHFIGDTPHVGKIHATVNRLWNSADKPKKIDVQVLNQTTILFRIENEYTRSRVLKRNFWHIADVPLVVQEWKPETTNTKPDVKTIPIWVDLKSVPCYLCTHKGPKFLGNIIGNAINLHPSTERCLRLDVAQILGEVNHTKPLPDQINIEQTPDLAFPIKVAYPWLPPKCVVCHKWGHVAKACNQQVKVQLLQRPDKIEVNKSDVQLPEIVSSVLTQGPMNHDVVPDIVSSASQVAGAYDKEKHIAMVNDTTSIVVHTNTESIWTTVIAKKSSPQKGVGSENGECSPANERTSPSRYSILPTVREEGEIDDTEKELDLPELEKIGW